MHTDEQGFKMLLLLLNVVVADINTARMPMGTLNDAPNPCGPHRYRLQLRDEGFCMLVPLPGS